MIFNTIFNTFLPIVLSRIIGGNEMTTEASKPLLTSAIYQNMYQISRKQYLDIRIKDTYRSLQVMIRIQMMENWLQGFF